MQLIRIVVLWVAMALPGLTEELVMIDQQGCHYCEKWTEEIGPIYPKTSEGKFAPLRRIDISEIPEDLQLLTTPVYTPTFILIEDNKELARPEGYPGDDFFWPLISAMLEAHTKYVTPR